MCLSSKVLVTMSSTSPSSCVNKFLGLPATYPKWSYGLLWGLQSHLPIYFVWIFIYWCRYKANFSVSMCPSGWVNCVFFPCRFGLAPWFFISGSYHWIQNFRGISVPLSDTKNYVTVKRVIDQKLLLTLQFSGWMRFALLQCITKSKAEVRFT